MRSFPTRFILGVVTVTVLLGLGVTGRVLRADDDEHGKKAPTPIGAWFGIARPCPANSVTDSPLHAEFCIDVCNLCPNAGILPPEVPMMPTLLADGTVTADDAGEISLFHTPAHGKWAVSEHDGLVDLPGTTRYKATFIWLGQTGPTGRLDNAVRPRFVTYFDPHDPDRMMGYIQPYFFPIATNGIVNVNPGSPLDPLAGNHIPTIDPLVSPLPEGCQLAKGCLGTYHFVIRRVQPQ
jgi:hypothetical protein